MVRSRTRLTLTDVQTILTSDDSHAALARTFRVTPKAVRDVRSGRTWKRYLPDVPRETS